MGFQKAIYLYCDGQTDACECADYEASSGDSQAETIAEYKASAKSDGWHFKGTRAYCSACWQALKSGKV